MIEKMRFSEIPLPRRLLIVLVTFAALAAVYWIVAAFVAVTPFWLDAVMAAGIVVFCVLGIRYDNRVRRRMEAERLAKPRRDR
jgi:ABC-type glucose/galactose transport system permease subunit